MTAGRHRIGSGRHGRSPDPTAPSVVVRRLPAQVAMVIICAGLIVVGAVPLAMWSIGSAAAQGQPSGPISAAAPCPPTSSPTPIETPPGGPPSFVRSPALRTPISPTASAAPAAKAVVPAAPCPTCPPVVGTATRQVAAPCCDPELGCPPPPPPASSTPTPSHTPTPPPPRSPRSRVVVTVSAPGSQIAFSYAQLCGSRRTNFTLTNGKSHTTKRVPAATVCTVTQTGGPPGVISVAVTGSAHASSVQNDPPRGTGSVRTRGSLKFTFTAPTGGVKVGQVTPSALPSIVAVPGKPARAFAYGATGNGRSPLIAPSTSPPVTPTAPTAEQITLDTQPAALAAPPAPPIRPAALAGVCALGLAVIGIAAFGARSATRRGR